MAREDPGVTFHEHVLSPVQQAILRRLGPIASRHRFDLGGGTAIAIRLGHRTSMDLDWFAERLDDPLRLAASLRDAGVDLQIESVDAGTLHGEVEGVRVIFLEYRYPTLVAPEEWLEYGCGLLSLADLACMKLSAIASRGSKRDFIDLFAIGRSGLELTEMLTSYQRRFATTDTGHVVMSLTWFDDAELEAMPEMLWDVDWKTIKRTIEGWVESYAGR